MMNLICPMDHILFQTFKIIFNILLKTIIKKIRLQQIIYPYKFKKFNKIKKKKLSTKLTKLKIVLYLRLKKSYKLELLSKQTMRLLGSTEKITAKDKTVKTYQNLKLQM